MMCLYLKIEKEKKELSASIEIQEKKLQKKNKKYKEVKMSKIKIFSLGGLNENGKNMYVVEVDKSLYIFDAGLKYDVEHNLELIILFLVLII